MGFFIERYKKGKRIAKIFEIGHAYKQLYREKLEIALYAYFTEFKCLYLFQKICHSMLNVLEFLTAIRI